MEKMFVVTGIIPAREISLCIPGGLRQHMDEEDLRRMLAEFSSMTNDEALCHAPDVEEPFPVKAFERAIDVNKVQITKEKEYVRQGDLPPEPIDNEDNILPFSSTPQ
jgi:LEA14-like dessication related protein